jgi:hypothetical protein
MPVNCALNLSNSVDWQWKVGCAGLAILNTILWHWSVCPGAVFWALAATTSFGCKRGASEVATQPFGK